MSDPNSTILSRQQALDILGLVGAADNLTDKIVNKAYKKLALKYHPDKNPDPSATAQFQLIAEAKIVLLSDGADLPRFVSAAAAGSSSSGSARSAASHQRHVCPNCDEQVFPPNDASTKLFRCPICRHILRNPFFVTKTAGETVESKSAVAVSNPIVVGTRVVVKGKFSDGTVRFVGLTDFADGEWYGVELDSPLGKHDGAVRGKRYFTCRAKYGLFLRREHLHTKQKLEMAVENLASDALRVFTGSLDQRRCEENACSIVWRCLRCTEPSSVCCRVNERRGTCVCGHKLASHRDRRGKNPSRVPFSCDKCSCKHFRYHIQQGGWAARCSCKHKHTDHDPITARCSKMIPGRKPCPCDGYAVNWVCNCGHPAHEHETVIVDQNSTSTFSTPDLAREWVCGGVRPEIRNEAAANRLKWAARGKAPRTASSAAREVVANDGKTIPMGRTQQQTQGDVAPFYKYRETQ